MGDKGFTDPDTPKYYANVVLVAKKLLGDTSLCDLTIKIGHESVQAHAGIVACRCEEILTMNQDEKSKKKRKHEERIKENIVKNAGIMHRVLEYIYTGLIDFPKLTIEEMLYVNQAARNLNLPRLGYLCEKYIQENLSMDNIYHYLRAAAELKEEGIKSICMEYALDHYVDFISNKNDIQIIGIDLFQEVVTAFNPAAKKDSDSKHFTPPPDTLIEDLKKLYQTMVYADSNISIGEGTISFHKYLLVAHSEIFNSFTPANLSAKSFRGMLKFLYYGDDAIDVHSACELVDISRKFKLRVLCRIVEEIAKSNITHKSVLEVLRIAYLPLDEEKLELVEEIKAKCLPYIIDHIHQINLSNLHEFPPLMVVDIVHQIKATAKTSRRRTREKSDLEDITRGRRKSSTPSSGIKKKKEKSSKS